jgi:hypothetical protein
LALKLVLKLNDFREKSLDLRLNLEGNARHLNSIVVTQSRFVDALNEVLAVFEAGADLIW